MLDIFPGIMCTGAARYNNNHLTAYIAVKLENVCRLIDSNTLSQRYTVT